MVVRRGRCSSTGCTLGTGRTIRITSGRGELRRTQAADANSGAILAQPPRSASEPESFGRAAQDIRSMAPRQGSPSKVKDSLARRDGLGRISSHGMVVVTRAGTSEPARPARLPGRPRRRCSVAPGLAELSAGPAWHRSRLGTFVEAPPGGTAASSITERELQGGTCSSERLRSSADNFVLTCRLRRIILGSP